MINYSALATELQTDPTGLGYAPLLVEGNDQGPADLLNLVRQGVQVFRNDVQSWELLAATVKADWDGLAAGDKQLFQALITVGTLDATSASLRQIVTALFPAGSSTRSNLASIVQRNGSRAEKLFGANIVILHQDVAKALGRG